MDEASSRYVDQLVLEKLVTEKLAKVRHAPKVPLKELVCQSFAGFVAPQPFQAFQERRDGDRIWLKSPVECTYAENRWLNIIEYPAISPRGSILLVHGLFEDNRAIYGFLIGELNRLGFSVCLMTLPFHYERRPQGSVFSGEYFFSAELGRTKRAFQQAVLEVQICYSWMKARHALPAYSVGFSMGGTVVLTVGGLTDLLDGACIVNPAACLSQVMWQSPLCRTIRQDLLSSGCSEVEVDDVLATFDPFLIKNGVMNIDKILMIYGLFDQVTAPSQYEALLTRWQLPEVHRYKSGHLNMLRVPRLAEDIARFFGRISAAAEVRATGAGL